MFETPHRFVDLPHARIATWSVGQGPAIVFVHGWPLWSATYRNLLPSLKDRFTCHLLDLPGAGKTQVLDPRSIDIRRHVQTVIETVDALGLDRYALVAFDSGGMVTRAVAAQRPEQVTGVVLGNTEMPGHLSRTFAQFATWAPSRVGQALMTSALRVPRLRRSRLGYGTCFVDRSLVDGEFSRLFIEPMLDSRDVRRRQFALLEGSDPTFVDEMEQAHASLRCPAQLIWGDRDPWFKLRGARACLPQFGAGAEIEVLPGKLFVHEEHPERFAAITARFLESTLGARAPSGEGSRQKR